MKGLMFDLLEHAVTHEHGAETWGALLKEVEIEGPFPLTDSFPDIDFAEMIDVLAERIGTTHDDVLRRFGRSSLAQLAERYPSFFNKHTSAKTFLITMNEVVHPEARRMFPGAYAPVFTYDAPDDDSLSLEYESNRQFCAWAEGMLEGAAAHFGETVKVSQSKCTKRGDARCVLVATFPLES